MDDDRSSLATEVDYPQETLVEARRLVGLGRKSIRLFSPTLDAQVYDDEQLVDSISSLLRGYAKAEVRILVANADKLAGRRSRLVQLSKRLPSKCLIRELIIENDRFDEDSLIIDHSAGIFRRQQQKTAFMHENARSVLKSRIEHFDYLWERSTSNVALRDLSL